MKKMFVRLFVFALVLALFAHLCGVAEAEVLWTNANDDGGALAAPPHYPSFMANKTLVVTSITTYHYHGKGAAPGTIELLELLPNSIGKSYGKWQATGRDGNGVRNAYWDVNVHVVIPAGHTYMIRDSNVATWTHNKGSSGTGFAWVMGYVQGEGQQPTPLPTPPTPTPTPPQPPTPTPGKGSEWVFVGTIRDDKEWQKQMAEGNKNTSFKTSMSSVSPNATTSTTTFVGVSGVDWLFDGARATAELTWTNPPGVIKPNQEFSMQLSFKLISCSAKCPSSGHQMGSWNVGADIITCDENGNPSIGSGYSQGHYLNSKDGKGAGSGGGGVVLGVPRNPTVYGTLNASSKKGERRSVRVKASLGNVTVTTHYIYEWR